MNVKGTKSKVMMLNQRLKNLERCLYFIMQLAQKKCKLIFFCLVAIFMLILPS